MRSQSGNFAHFFINLPEVRLHAVEYEQENPPTESTPILLLHGFPEFWYSWRFLMPLLAKGSEGKTYRVIAIDQRGYNLSSKPPRVSDYALSILTKDIARVIGKVAPEKRVYLVGHDWGGAIAWDMARRYPKRVQQLFVLNCPPVEVLLRGVFKVPRQLLQSFYIFLFQIPKLPEFILARNGGVLLRVLFQGMRGPDGSSLSEREVEDYLRAFCQSKGLSGINYYRAALRASLTGRVESHPPKIPCPTKVIWGTADSALNIGLTRNFSDLVTTGNYQVRYVPGASHFIQQESPGICASEILDAIK